MFLILGFCYMSCSLSLGCIVHFLDIYFHFCILSLTKHTHMLRPLSLPLINHGDGFLDTHHSLLLPSHCHQHYKPYCSPILATSFPSLAHSEMHQLNHLDLSDQVVRGPAIAFPTVWVSFVDFAWLCTLTFNVDVLKTSQLKQEKQVLISKQGENFKELDANALELTKYNII